MSWSKLKQQLESFLAPGLAGRVGYRATSYHYLTGRPGNCYLTVDHKNILNMNDSTSPIRWYQSDQEIKSDPNIYVPVNQEEIDAIRIETQGAVPEERLPVMARSRKSAAHAKGLWLAQAALTKSNFNAATGGFLTSSIEDSLDSPDILLNILALVDRRVGRKRLLNMSEVMRGKHPAVQYFYELRRSTL